MSAHPEDASFVPPSLAGAVNRAGAGGEVRVVLRGVRDRRHLRVLTASLGRIPGIGAIAVERYERPDSPVLSVAGIGIVGLTGLVRRRLGVDVRSVERVDGRVEVVLADAAGEVGGRRVPEDLPLRPADPRGGGAPSRPAPGPRGPVRPWTQPDGESPWVPDLVWDAAARVAPERRTAASDAASMLTALGAEDDLAILIHDRDLVVRAAYGGLHARSPRLRDGLVGRDLDDVLPPATYVGLRARMTAALQGRGGEIEVADASGDRHLRITVQPIRAEGGITGCISVSRDVTGQHRDAGLLFELTDVFDATFERSPAGQALVSPDGRWLRLNDALRRLLGREDAELLGATLFDVTLPEERAREQDLLLEVRSGAADGYEVEKHLVHAGGLAVRVYVRMTPVRAVDGAVVGFVAHVVDADRWAPASR